MTFLCPCIPPGSAPCSHSSLSLGHQQNPKSINKKATKTQPVCLSSLEDFQWCWRQELGMSVASSSDMMLQPWVVGCWSRVVGPKRFGGASTDAGNGVTSCVAPSPSPSPRTPGCLQTPRVRVALSLPSPCPSRGTASPFSQFGIVCAAFCTGAGGSLTPPGLGCPAGTVPTAGSGQTGISVPGSEAAQEKSVESETGGWECDSGCVNPGQRCPGQRKSLLIHGLGSPVAFW